MNTTIVAVVVTYNRFELLKQCIEALNHQTRKLDGIIVINNGSTDGTEKWLADQKGLLVFNQENTGGSGGFCRGIKEAYNKKFDWIWVMDDDAFADKYAAEELFKGIEKNGEKQDCCFYSNNEGDIDFVTDQKIVKIAIFVGLAIPAKIIKTIGFPRNDFFIFWDDVEYCLRIAENKFKIIRLKNSIINHRASDPLESYEKKIFNFRISFYKLTDFKLFYFIRNRLLMFKPFTLKWFKSVAFVFYILSKILVLSDQKAIVLKAIYNGLIRKGGKYNFKSVN